MLITARALFSLIAVLPWCLMSAPLLALPNAEWTPSSAEVELAPGGTESVPVTLDVDEEVTSASFFVVPELQPFVSVNASEFDGTIPEGTMDVDIVFDIPEDAAPGVYEGTISLRSGNRALALPLPIVLTLVSNGPTLIVPDVVGLPQADAEAAVVAAGLAVGTVSTANSDTVPAGDVISQDPVAGTEVAPDSAVNLVVSTGPVLVTVPDVSGLPQADAEAAIAAAGLAVGTVSTANSDTVPAGDVISQDPTGGTEVTPGSAVDLVVSTGPAVADLELLLDKNVVNAPDTAMFAVIFYDAAGNVLDPAPVPDCEVIADLNASSGSVPAIVSSAIVTFEDTRGVYALVCTEPNSGLSDGDDLVVLPPATDDSGDTTQTGLYGGLGAALGEANLLAMLLEDAIFDGAIGDVPALLAELRAVRDTVDLAKLQRSTAFAPEVGFLPTPNELALVGFVAGPDDAAYEAALDAITANLEETAALLAGIADFPSAPDAVSDAFLELNDELESLAAQLELLKPSLHGLVSLKGKINLVLAMTVPAQLHAWVNAYDQALQDFDLAHNALAIPFQYAAFGGSAQNLEKARLIPAVFAPSLLLPEGFGNRSEVQPAFFSVAEFSVAMQIRMEIVNRVYAPVMVEISKSVVLLEINGLLQAYNNDVTLLGIETGGLLTLHVFEFPGSAIESSAINPLAPRNHVLLIGPGQIPTVRDVINAFNASQIESFEDIFDFFEVLESIVDALQNVHQPPDGTTQCFLFGVTPPCYRAVYASGFKPVASPSSLPFNVLFLVHNLDEGTWASEVFPFLLLP